MYRVLFFGLVLTAIVIQGCQNDDAFNEGYSETITATDQMQIKFAKTLATAINESLELRNLIKEEALKQFDKDYDVLYYLIKDQKVGNETVSQLLAKYAESEDEFRAIEENMPLLTIFVPKLPDFSAESWNSDKDIPKVAVDLSADEKVTIIDFEGQQEEIEAGMIPAFPVVVVKRNERLVVEESNLKSGNPFPFRFIDESFDGSIKTEFGNGSKKSNLKRGFSGALDWSNAFALSYQSYVKATVEGNDKLWHRDHAYYGMTLNKSEGEFRNDVSEFLTAIRFTSDLGLQKISDQDIDPKIVNRKLSSSAANWTEGHFEFVIDIVINSKNGVGDVLQKRFPIKADELFDVSYKRKGWYYVVDEIEPNTVYVNLELLPWDLNSYGDAWKFIVSEYDPSEVVERSHTSKSEFSKNFSVSISGILKKIGWKLGGSTSSTESKSSTVKISTTKDSDQLGEAILTFDQPMIMYGHEMTGVRYISTGYIELYVMSQEVY